MFKEMNYKEMTEIDGGLVVTTGIIGGGIVLLSASLTALATYFCTREK